MNSVQPLFHHCCTFEVDAPPLQAMENKRVPFGWTAKAVDKTGSGNVTRLRPARKESDAADEAALPSAVSLNGTAAGYIRMTIAIDIREEVKVEARLPHTREMIGVFDIRYAYPLQIFEIPVSANDVSAVLDHGVELNMIQGNAPIWFFVRTESDGSADTLLPHLLLPQGSIGTGCFFRQLASVSSVQPFGWMEGCVLDALYDLDEAFPGGSWRNALIRHLHLFMTEDGGLIYENPRSVPFDNTIYGVEGGLPFAVIAKLWPDHPLVHTMIRFCLSARRSDERIAGDAITAEGAYTIAYPLAVIAQAKGRRDLAELSVRQLLLRKQLLATERGLSQLFGAGRETFHNWARGYAWYMLGLVRTIIALRSGGSAGMPSTERLEEECLRISRLAMSYQQRDGLWHCFVDDPHTGVDTSGTAGIAAALALGANCRILPQEAFDAAKRTYAGLQPYLTPDGLLTCVAQSNRNGESLQKNGYRVLSQMAMGLMGQLAAAVGRV